MSCCEKTSTPRAATQSTACCGTATSCAGKNPASVAWFDDMIPHCLEYAKTAREQGRPVVGILCEYTPREVILAAGAVPVCLCGGSADTIADAEKDLPVLLCPLIKSTYGYHVQKSNPFLEMVSLIVAEDTCDGKKKMYELMAEERPIHILELPKKQGDDNALAYWESEIRRLIQKLETRFGVTITEEGLRDTVKLMNLKKAVERD